MSVSVVDPIGPAIERTKRVCFQPFDLGKWFTIGFCAFLAALAGDGAGGTSYNFGFRYPGGRIDGGKELAAGLRHAIDSIQVHLVAILAIGLIVLLVSIALGALFVWLGCRGQFMFIDNILRNRGAVAAPWHEYRKEGNSLFVFRFLFGLAVLLTMLAIPLGTVLLALPDIQAQRFGPAAWSALAVLMIGLLVVSVVATLINLFLNDFVVPIMYLRHIGVIEAWLVFYTEMLAGHAGIFVLYVLFKIVLSIGVAFLMTILCCCTFCIAVIPYLGSHVLVLPIHVFWRSYSLYFVEQFGPEWRLFSMAEELPVELVDEEDEGPEERFHPRDERIRPADDFDLPPDDRTRPR